MAAHASLVNGEEWHIIGCSTMWSLSASSWHATSSLWPWLLQFYSFYKVSKLSTLLSQFFHIWNGIVCVLVCVCVRAFQPFHFLCKGSNNTITTTTPNLTMSELLFQKHNGQCNSIGLWLFDSFTFCQDLRWPSSSSLLSLSSSQSSPAYHGGRHCHSRWHFSLDGQALEETTKTKKSMPYLEF